MDGEHLDRFLSRIVRAEGCWEWDGAHFGNGYAETWDGQRPLGAHRVAYELWTGPIPDGAVIDHLCDNRGCVNPDHLQATTHQANILRGTGQSARNARKAQCIHGHEFTPENTHVDPKGTRMCRKCWAASNRARVTHCPNGHEYEDESYRLDTQGRRRCQLCVKTHCPQGHSYSGDNLYVSKRGDRMCKTCRRQRVREWRQRQSSQPVR